MLPIIYAAATFTAVAVGGLVVLRRLTDTVARGVGFVLLCYAALRGTFWLSRQWNLDPVELGYAWAAALVLIVIVEGIRRARRRSELKAFAHRGNGGRLL